MNRSRSGPGRAVPPATRTEAPTPVPGSEGSRASGMFTVAPEFRALRELRDAFGRGGLPPAAERTPEESARLAVYCTLKELLHLVAQFQRRAGQDEHVDLVVRERGRELGRVVFEIAIEPKGTKP
jgi:hypothetical protein